MRLKYVVLPAPFGPTIAVSEPGRNSQDTPFTATCPPKRMVRPRVARTGCSTSALVLDADGNLHLLGLDLAHELRHRPRHVRIDFDLEVIHRLHCLVVFLAEGHAAFRGLEGHAFHR